MFFEDPMMSASDRMQPLVQTQLTDFFAKSKELGVPELPFSVEDISLPFNVQDKGL
jgi:hypothetical protein